ncbi:MAG TPA: antibiotic biosynthesis monooxygenase [Steroidobacteraceae bacterium]|jgi:heme-degrading monooxygenase HmoA|nr:antibiotic biosynthesis monooxygenase [Steroidobacteraceae bacterium]
MAGYTYLWEFIVKPNHLEEFEQCYGPSGSWVALFRQAPGYIDTLRVRDRADPQRFITIDRWRSADAHRSFRCACSVAYAELDARCAHLAARETSSGEFDEALP